MVYSLLLSFFIKDSSNPFFNVKIKETNALFLTKRWGGGEEKQYKKELDIDMIEVDCRKKAKYFPITLTCKRSRIEAYILY